MGTLGNISSEMMEKAMELTAFLRESGIVDKGTPQRGEAGYVSFNSGVLHHQESMKPQSHDFNPTH